MAPPSAGALERFLVANITIQRMLAPLRNAQKRNREARLFAARTGGGVYVDVFVHVHETSFEQDQWVQTGRSYRLRDGTRVNAGAPGELTLASTGEVLTLV